ncbi:MAG: hypothetical protein IPK82_33405 [Polyangiaceae bacterium]|nr:hypothetical protein [Polyangiaceae bacterium]
MQFPNETPLLCALCGEQPATDSYARSERTKRVCAICLERLNLRSAYEDKLPHISALERNGQYDEALMCLDAILDASRDHDHEQWLARSIADHRVLVLLDAGRYAEAEEACAVWAKLGFADVSQRWMHALAWAHALEGLDRDREALVALEDALGYEDPKYLPSVLGALTELVRLSAKVGHAVDPKWAKTAAAIAERYGVEMPDRHSLSDAIVALEEMTRGKQPKRLV